MDMPHAPMPPPPPAFTLGGPPGAIHVDDWQGPMASPLAYDDPLVDPPMTGYPDERAQTKTKKNKDKNKNFSNERVDVSFKGYVLEKAAAQIGHKASWARIGKRNLPVDADKLVAIIKAHRLRTGTGPGTDFITLSSNQQGILNRLIAQHNLAEKNHNAEWVLADVQRFGSTRWGKMIETKTIRVILKRQDKNSAKPGDRASRNPTSFYTFGEIIDLADPLPLKKDKDGEGNKKGKKQQQQQQWEDDQQPIDEPYEPGWDQREPMHNAYPDQHHHHQQHQQAWNEPMQQPIGPQLPDPMAYAPQNDMPQHNHQNYQAQQNPFMPNPNIMVPGQYDQPIWGGDNQHLPRACVQTPAAEPRRRSASARRLRRLETNIDQLREKVENWNISSGDSSEGHRDRDSVWTDPQTAGTRTPLSSPPLSEDMWPRGDYDRHRKRDKDERRPRRYRDEARERRYRDDRIEVQPHYTHRSRREIQYELESPRRHEGRCYSEAQYSPVRERYAGESRPRFGPQYEAPRLHRAQTYDDYPMARPAERERLQRRLTDYPAEGYHQYADYDEQNRGLRSRRRDSAGRALFDPEYEAFQAGKALAGRRASGPGMEEPPYARRRSGAEVGGGYYI